VALLRRRLTPRVEAMAGVEDAIRADPDWQYGVGCHAGGPGHPEATVRDHVEEVLANVAAEPPELQERLRVIALVHDAFKHRVRPWRPDHAHLAERFARRYVDDPGVLKVIRRHDDAYRAWRLGQRTHLWWLARARARALIADLGDDLGLFRAFYRCDNATGNKTAAPRDWFEEGVAEATRAARTSRRS
jgi:hypothetical protein